MGEVCGACVPSGDRVGELVRGEGLGLEVRVGGRHLPYKGSVCFLRSLPVASPCALRELGAHPRGDGSGRPWEGTRGRFQGLQRTGVSGLFSGMAVLRRGEWKGGSGVCEVCGRHRGGRVLLRAGPGLCHPDACQPWAAGLDLLNCSSLIWEQLAVADV